MYHIGRDPVRYVKFRQSFGPLKVIAQIQLEYADGTDEIIGTDSTLDIDLVLDLEERITIGNRVLLGAQVMTDGPITIRLVQFNLLHG